MVSEFLHQLNPVELKTLTNSLLDATANHLRWLSSVNYALVCRDKESQHICLDNTPYKKCQFGQWYYHESKTILDSNAEFQTLETTHKEMHLKVCDLIDTISQSKKVTDESYAEFAALQLDFFEILQSITTGGLKSLGNIDFLTDLPNRREFSKIFKQESNRISRSNAKSSIVMADIDFFKKINDCHGHKCGDMVLIQLANLFRESIREYDTVARFGGEEFVLCLPETDIQEAEKIIENIRKKIESKEFSTPTGPVKITCSFGIACCDGNTSHNLALARADAALYDAKNMGRNITRSKKVT